MAGGVVRKPISSGSEDEGSSPPVGISPSKAKGKARRIPDPTTIEYAGDERCELCIQGEVRYCVVDRAVHEKWAADWESGTRGKKAPDGSLCQTCAKVHKRCELPATRGYRPPVLKRKRGGADDEVETEGRSKPVGGVKGNAEEPASKRVKQSVRADSSEVGPSAAESFATSAAALEGLLLVGRNVAKELRIQNFLLSRLVQASEGPLPRFLRGAILGDDEEMDRDFDPSAWLVSGESSGGELEDGEEEEEGEGLLS